MANFDTDNFIPNLLRIYLWECRMPKFSGGLTPTFVSGLRPPQHPLTKTSSYSSADTASPVLQVSKARVSITFLLQLFGIYGNVSRDLRNVI